MSSKVAVPVPGSALPHPVPVVDHSESRPVGGNQSDHRRTLGIAGQHLGIVGVQRAGGEELLPLSRYPSPSRDASLVCQVNPPAGVEPSSVEALPTIAPDSANSGHPAALLGIEPQPLLDVGEMPAQDVRNVHVAAVANSITRVNSSRRLAPRHRRRWARAAHRGRYGADELDCGERPFAGAFAFQRALADSRDQLWRAAQIRR